MHLVRLRNVPASVWEAVDSSQEQAEVGKQNKQEKTSENNSKVWCIFISVECVALF